MPRISGNTRKHAAGRAASTNRRSAQLSASRKTVKGPRLEFLDGTPGIQLEQVFEFERGRIYWRPGNERFMCVRATMGMGTLVRIEMPNFPENQGFNHEVLEFSQCEPMDDIWWAEI